MPKHACRRDYLGCLGSISFPRVRRSCYTGEFTPISTRQRISTVPNQSYDKALFKRNLVKLALVIVLTMLVMFVWDHFYQLGLNIYHWVGMPFMLIALIIVSNLAEMGVKKATKRSHRD